MNRFVKKNFMMVGILAVSGVVVLALAVYAVIIILEMEAVTVRANKALADVEAQSRNKIFPGKKNLDMIISDADFYEEKLKELRGSFQSPLQEAVDAFIAKLQPPLKSRLSEEEIERFREPAKEGEEELSEEEAKKRIKIRKLTLNEFKELYNNRLEANSDAAERRRVSLSDQLFFVGGFRQLFSNWPEALNEFIKRAEKLTDEPIGQTNAVSLLLYAMGFPRSVPDTAQFMQHMEGFRNVVVAKADVAKMILGVEASNFLLPISKEGTINLSNQFSISDCQALLFHWDVYGDIINRVGGGKSDRRITALHNILVRKFPEAEENSAGLAATVETVGNANFYHYTIEVAGSMEAIRELTARFDMAYKEKRTYIVRAVTLYAQENGAAVLMKQVDAEELKKNESEKQAQIDGSGESEEPRRRRRRVRRRDDEFAAPDIQTRRNRRNSDESVKNENDKEEVVRDDYEKRLAVHERSDYGVPVIGASDQIRAFIDIDYVIVKSEQ